MKLEGGAYHRVGGVSVIAHGDCESRLDNLPDSVQRSTAGTGMFDTGMASCSVSSVRAGESDSEFCGQSMSGSVMPSSSSGKHGPDMVVPSDMVADGLGTVSKSGEIDATSLVSSSVSGATIGLGNSSCEKYKGAEADRESISDVKIMQGNSQSDLRGQNDVRTTETISSAIGASSLNERDIAVVKSAATVKISNADVNKSDSSTMERFAGLSEVSRTHTSENILYGEDCRKEKPRSRNPSERPSRTSKFCRIKMLIFSVYLEH